MSLTIRRMRPEDVDRAAAAVLAGNWGDRTVFFRFVASHGRCHPFVADEGGEIVATGVGTANGAVGWVGTIFVAASHRRLGLGTAMTEAVGEALAVAGCRTLVLVATDAGRPLYEQLGFRVQTHYRTFEAPGLAPRANPDPAIRPFDPADLPAVIVLDRQATGEDRGHLLTAFADAASSRVLVGEDGVRGFIVRAPWGGGATVVPDPAGAARLLDARRRAAGPERIVRAGVLEENRDGVELLVAAGWHEAWSAPRLVRGAEMTWRPGWIWGQLNHALG